MTKNTTEKKMPFLASHSLVVLFIALAVIAVSAVLSLTGFLRFDTEFGGGSTLTVRFPSEPTQENVDLAVKTVEANTSAAVLSVQKYSTDSLLIRTTPMEDTAKVKSAVASALSVSEDFVKADTTARSVTKDALFSIATSLLIAGAIVLVYFALRFGILAALATLFGFVSTVAGWLLSYTFLAVFDYTAFTVLAVSLALFTLLTAVVLGKKIKKASDMASPFVSTTVVIAAGSLALGGLILAIACHMASVAFPLVVAGIFAMANSLYTVPAFVMTFKK